VKIVDLIDSYQSSFVDNGDREEYEKSFPELFQHYYQFWAKGDSDITVVDREQIDTRKKWISELIERLEAALERHDIDFNSLTCVLMVGVGSTNGHAFRHDSRCYVWLPLETYTSEKLVEVFVTHEIAHALHYKHSPSYYFYSKDEQLQVSRQLVTEGLATFLTKELLDISALEALWADYLDERAAQEWWQACREEDRNLFQLIYEKYHEVDHELEIFYANNPENIYQFRSGYYAGLKLIEQYVNEYSVTMKQLLMLPRDYLDDALFNQFEQQL
jgi:uncharacterized protein YjaZ